ncbi:MAG: hypothetical protein DDT24_00412 [Chloroflexi bacterium]|nr:hypothetical protein [Chloroflexota bacterium]MBT9165964.1 hypothetical protein [Chloroflexota bacterium]
MQINVAQQLKSPLGDIRYYSIDETSREGSRIRGEVKLVRTNRSILVTGQLRTVIESTCSRCLEAFECPLEFEMEEEYFPTSDILSGLAVPVSEEVDDFIIGGDHILDLNEAVRQNILIGLPSKPLCQVGCAGLCQKCGYNLNYGLCHCLGY